MKNILSVFKRDMKAVIKNPVAILIIGGICVIPSLYAWVNIKACWNPYENTSTVPIAVVNNDTGTTLDGKDLNMGDEVVSELKDNKDIGWKFVDSKQADLGVVGGKYYAVIEIPEDFSKNLTSLTTDNPVKPNIIYKVDTKANPVAGKITDVAKEQLINEIKSNFVSTVNKIAFSSLNKVGDKIEQNKNQIIEMKNAIIKVNKNMDLINGALNGTSTNAKNLSEYLNSIKSTMPQLTNGISAMQNGTEQSKDLTKYTRNTLDSSFNNLEMNLNQMQASSQKITSLMKDLNSKVKEEGSQNISTTISMIKEEINYINNNIDTINKFLTEINKKANKDNISKLITSLNNVKTSLSEESSKLDKLSSSFNETGKLNENILNEISSLNSSANNNVKNTMNIYTTSTKSAISKICDNYIKATEEANKLLGNSKGMVSSIDTLLNTAIDGSNLTSEMAGKLEEKLKYFESSMGELSKKLEGISDDNIQEIVTVLQSNPEVMGEYISDPFNVKNESIYKIPNYGSGMAPIYSVLAVWVGGLILTSLLSTKVTPFEGSEKLTIREKYLGKLMTFTVLAMIQGFIITMGDKLLLGVYTVNAPLLILFGIVSSFTFSTIIYTLVSLFGNVGKALAIIWMVIQIAGSGGSYPIQVDPLFFRILQPSFPFTYALGGFREAIGGPLISSVVLDFTMLFIFAIVFILIGIFFKEKINKYTNKFEEKFEESGIAE
ncbi:YhgE/Pip domain-containing protein [Clostridium baratii]|uniref:YhgE/Pip domain-containing protein n=1 Tax=Clostridium baratii TaxID=1561 RepID=UPI0030D34748